jgi:hypothetical protein
MMTASMLRRRTKTRIKTLSADFSYQLYFIETCICQLRNVFAKLPF